MTALGPAAVTHERWFVSVEGPPIRWEALSEPGTLAAIGTAVLISAAVAVAWRVSGKRPIAPGPLAMGASRNQLAVIYGWTPFLLATHTAVPLVVAGVRNHLFVPNLVMGLTVGVFVGLAQVGVALLLFYGAFSRYAALALVAIWMAGVGMFGPVLLLEHFFFVGIGAFFWITGRGPVAIDRMFGRWAHAREDLLAQAIPVLRISVGISLAWLALSEKLLNLPLALAFVEEFSFVNFFPALGVPVSDATFMRMAGTVELTAGLLLIAGAFPRLVILMLWLPFNLTLTAFGWVELVGHLPIYAIMALILLWGAGGREEEKAFHAGLTPVRGKPVERGALVEQRGDRLG